MSTVHDPEPRGARAPADRFQHLTFVGERKPRPAHPSERHRRSPDATTVVLVPDSFTFFESLCDRWGLSAFRYRNSIFVRRQAACLRALRVTSPADGARAIERDPAASERALGAIMIGVTEFFRDSAVFEELQQLLRPLKQGSRPLRALSLGCSDGSELYSLAMLMAEEGLLGGARLHGMDCRPSAIRTAGEGIYAAAALESVAPSIRARYFVSVPHKLARVARGAGKSRGSAGRNTQYLRVIDPLRDACDWSTADAFKLPSEADREPLDLILCRNLAIYLTPESAAELWALCASSLRPGGLLVTGKAERPPVEIRAGFNRVGRCIYRRR